MNERELQEVYVSQRRSPNLVIQQHLIPGSNECQQKAVQQDIAWVFLRMLNQKEQKIPGWSGFVSKIGEVDNFPFLSNGIYKVLYDEI